MLELENKIYKPYFITFEGGENSGKTTQSKMLYEYLLSKGIKAIHTREPGGTPEAEKICDIVVNHNINQMTEFLLCMAARYEHLYNVIIPALNNNQWVICDRFMDSTLCYQGWDVDIDQWGFYDFIDIMPEITFLMNIKPEICILRIKNKDIKLFHIDILIV